MTIALESAAPYEIVDDLRRREFLGVLAAAGLIAGCGEGSGSSESGAETRTITDGAGLQVEIPVRPQRVVFVADRRLAAPVVTLGYVPAAVGGDGDPVGRLRGLGGTPGDLSTVQVISNPTGETDLEAVTAVRPDLIITQSEGARVDIFESLAAIAPTVQIDVVPTEGDLLAPQRFLADVVGVTDAFEARIRQYEQRLAEVKAALPGVFDRLVYSLFDSYPEGNFAPNVPSLPAEVVLADLGANRSVLSSTVAARNDQIFQVNSDVWTFELLQGQLAVLDDIERLFTGRNITTGQFR